MSSGQPARSATGDRPRRAFRRWLASFAWAAAVNFSLIAGTDPPIADHPPAPIASYSHSHRTNRLINETWAVGEYVDGAVPGVVVYAGAERLDDLLHERWPASPISLN